MPNLCQAHPKPTCRLGRLPRAHFRDLRASQTSAQHVQYRVATRLELIVLSHRRISLVRHSWRPPSLCRFLWYVASSRRVVLLLTNPCQIGGGPAALAAALTLAQNGIPIRIIDKATQTHQSSRGSGLHVRPTILPLFYTVALNVAAGKDFGDLLLSRNTARYSSLWPCSCSYAGIQVTRRH